MLFHRNFLRLAMLWLGATFASLPMFASAAYVSTYDNGGWVVNANTISDPNNAWLNGGPENDKAKGLKDGLYFYQVTDPSGKTLLSTDDIGCRIVEVINGVVAQAPASNDPRLTGLPHNASCFHQAATAKGLPTVPGQGGNPLVLMPFANTPAQGGNYKMWLVPSGDYDQTCTITAGKVTDSSTCTGVFGFPNSSSITDNFKIICQPSSITGSSKSNGGSGYAVGDTGTIDGSTTADPATYVVASVDGTGSVTGYVITYTGSGYQNNTGYATTKNTGNGTGFTITTTSIGGDTCTGSANPAYIISGVKFNDVNQNGLRDNGEPLLAGWTVNVTVGNTTTPVLTDANGNWSIAIPPTVPFQACEVMQTGWLQSAPNANYPVPTQNATLVADPNNSQLKCWSDTTPAADTAGYDFGNYQLSDLSVSKTATPGFTRTYNWSITKTSDKDRINIPNGQTATFNYTVGVSETGFTDSAWAVTGTISVTNPNKLVDFTGVNVVDQIDNNGTCTVTGGSGNGTSETIAANTKVDFTYSCTFTGNPNSGTNTATASWDNTVFVTPDASKNGTANYTFGDPTNRVNQSVTVTDSVNGTLGTAGPATDATPYYSTSYQYQRQITGVAGTCTDYGNTATITQTSQKAEKSVKVCVGLDLSVAKTAATNFTAAISKSVDKPLVQQSGGNITLNYTVNVTESNWTVSGKITVTNPNDWEGIVANVGDALSDVTGVCTVTNGTGATIPASSAVDFDYSCSFAASPAAGSGTNTGAATWNNATYFTPNGSASGQAAYQFSTLTVSDCWGLKGGTPCTPASLGSVTIPPG